MPVFFNLVASWWSDFWSKITVLEALLLVHCTHCKYQWFKKILAPNSPPHSDPFFFFGAECELPPAIIVPHLNSDHLGSENAGKLWKMGPSFPHDCSSRYAPTIFFGCCVRTTRKPSSSFKLGPFRIGKIWENAQHQPAFLVLSEQ